MASSRGRTVSVWVNADLAPGLVGEIAGTGWKVTNTRRSNDQVTALVVANDAVGRKEVELFPNLRLIHKWGAGLDAIDVDYAASRGIRVTNSPGVNATSVAEHAVALVLAAARRLPVALRHQEAGTWGQSDLLSQGVRSLRGSKVGLVGFGAVGRELARLCLGLGMTVLYTKRTAPDTDDASMWDAQFMDLDTLLSTADVVILVASASQAEPTLLTDERFGLMRQDVIFVNVARASLVDEAALLRFVAANPASYACLDVISGEATQLLPEVDSTRALITPHVAGRDRAAVRALNTDVLRALSELDQ